MTLGDLQRLIESRGLTLSEVVAAGLNAIPQRKHVAIFGGAFDPPHIGHLKVAETVLALPEIDNVWFTPCHKHVFDKKLSRNEVRSAMLNRLVGADQRMSVCLIEFNQQLDGSTHTLVTKLREQHPDVEFSVIIGSDNALTIEKWVRADHLLNMVPFIVVPRKGYELQDLPPIFDSTRVAHRLLDVDLPLVSSTEIREDIRNGRRSSHLLPRIVDYIDANHLYHGA